MPVILISVAEITVACNYIKEFDHGSYRAGVNKLSHVVYLLTDQSIVLGNRERTRKYRSDVLVLARRLTKNNAHTLEALKDHLIGSFTHSVSVRELSSAFDVKAWMEGSINQIPGYIHLHAFKIQNDMDGQSRLSYKKWLSSPVWLPA